MANINNYSLYIECTACGREAEKPVRCSSLKQAVAMMYRLPGKGRFEYLLCCGNCNLDVPKQIETREQYYKRMRKLFHELYD